MRQITFVGKLNRSKGYDIFGNAVIKILNKYPNWKANVVGDEQRDKIEFKHKNLKNYGFIPHNKVIDIYKRTSIAIVCSRWEEPFGRTSLGGIFPLDVQLSSVIEVVFLKLLPMV